MNYISDLLCHFVGRSCATDDERFELLVKIIKEQQLRANLKEPYRTSLETSSIYSGNRLGEIFEKCDCVCFCDIPDEMLDIHTSKYSKFGMGFNKTFLAQEGARPVLYVPTGAKMKQLMDKDASNDSPMNYYLYLNKLSNSLNVILSILNTYNPFGAQLAACVSQNENILSLLQLLDKDIAVNFLQGKAHQLIFSEITAISTLCAYVKIFDENLADNDPNNYYMEREWRSLKSVDFTLKDIQKVYLPSRIYVEKFMAAFPDYKKDFWVFNEHGNR